MPTFGTSLGTVFVSTRADDSKLDGDFKKVKKSFGVAGAAAAAAFAAAIAIGMKQAIQDASNLQEAMSKFDVVFKGQIGLAKEWSKVLTESYAMSTREAVQFLSSIQDLLVPMGMAADEAGRMSNEVVKLAADLGSFNNLPTEQVMLDIQSALVGNFETMKKYGVVLNATTVQQRALDEELADTKEALTAADKAQAAFMIISEGSTAAIGDMERTADGFANTLKAFTAEWEDLSATIGTVFLPMATKAIQALREIVELTSGGDEGGFWSFFWGESEMEKNKARIAEAIELATSYQDEFTGITVGGDATEADQARLESVRQTLESEHAFFLDNFSKIDEARLNNAETRKEMEDEFREERMEKMLAEHNTELELINSRTKAMSDAAGIQFKIEQDFTKNKKKEEADRQKIQEITMRTALSNTTFALREMGRQNATAFAAYKAVKIAETVIATAASAQKSYDAMASIPYVGPALGAAAAAAAIAAGAMQISAISSATAGGGGSVSTGGFSAAAGGGYGGAAPTFDADPVTGIPSADIEPQRTISVNIENYVDSDENRRNFVEWLNEFIEDDGGRLVSSESKSAERLL